MNGNFVSTGANINVAVDLGFSRAGYKADTRRTNISEDSRNVFTEF